MKGSFRMGESEAVKAICRLDCIYANITVRVFIEGGSVIFQQTIIINRKVDRDEI